MTQPMPGLVNDADCDCLDRVLQSGELTADILARCKACGLDVSKAELENRQQMELAASLKREFRPDRV